jgi:uncharacterized iron-regulated membrane protein
MDWLKHKTQIRWHRLAAWIVFIPFSLTLVTGSALLLRKQIPWIQPTEAQSSGPGIPASMQALVDTLLAHPSTGIKASEEIRRIDLRPKSGIIKVLSAEGIETQLDAQSGRFLQAAPRRNEWIEDLHQGSFLGSAGIYTWGLGMAVGLWLVWGSGLYLLILPHLRKWRIHTSGSKQKRS